MTRTIGERRELAADEAEAAARWVGSPHQVFETFATCLDELVQRFQYCIPLRAIAAELEGQRVRVIEAHVRRERLVKSLVDFFSAGSEGEALVIGPALAVFFAGARGD